jgi:hypothetical protein
LENVFKKNKEKDDVLSHRQMDEIMGVWSDTFTIQFLKCLKV